MGGHVMHDYADKVVRSLRSDIKVLFVHLNEDNDDVEFGQVGVALLDGINYGGFVFLGIESDRDIEAVERHVCGCILESILGSFYTSPKGESLDSKISAVRYHNTMTDLCY